MAEPGDERSAEAARHGLNGALGSEAADARVVGDGAHSERRAGGRDPDERPVRDAELHEGPGPDAASLPAGEHRAGAEPEAMLEGEIAEGGGPDDPPLLELDGRTSATDARRGRYYVEALGRGLAVLDCFIGDPGPHALVELSRRVGLGMPTTLRLIRTLVEAGYVRQEPSTKRYRLSWKMLQLQDVTSSILDYADLARPHLQDLAEALGEATGMAVLDGLEVRHAIRVSSKRIVAANIPPGALFPAHATAMGKVLLAELDAGQVRDLAVRYPFVGFTPTTVTSVDEFLAELREVARQGYAVSDAEWDPGLRSVAAPVREQDGRVVAAVCALSVQSTMTVRDMQRQFLPAVIDTAAAISRELGYDIAWRRS